MENCRPELPVFIRWEEFLLWLLPVLDSFPKKARFTLSGRMENLALDIVEDLVEARYSREKVHLLKRANLKLEKLRILLRISNQLKYLSHQRFEFAIRKIAECGGMVGGWIKQQEQR